MEATNQESFCISCHDFDSMDFDKQESRSSDRHEEAIDNGWSCIDCHKGIAHQLPAGYDPADDTPGGEEGDDS